MREKDRIAKLAKESALNYGEFIASKERTLKTNNKIATNKRLYLEGYRKGFEDVPLETFTDLIEENGKMVQRKDHRSFKAGYIRGLADGQVQLVTENTHKSRR